MVDGARHPLDLAELRAVCATACIGLEESVSADLVLEHALRNLYDGVAVEEVTQALILSARSADRLASAASIDAAWVASWSTADRHHCRPASGRV